MSKIDFTKKDLTSIKEILSVFVCDTEEYLKQFEANDLVSFLESNTLKKKYSYIYATFIEKAEIHITKIEPYINHISEAICLADMKYDDEEAAIYQSQFEDYSLFATSLTLFITKSENLIKKDNTNFKVSYLLEYARELLSSIKTYKSKL